MNTGADFTLTSVPTENACIFVSYQRPSDSAYSREDEIIVPLDQLREGGYDFLLDAEKPSDEIQLSIRPIYNVSGIGSNTGRNLYTTNIRVTAPEPPPAEPEPEP